MAIVSRPQPHSSKQRYRMFRRQRDWRDAVVEDAEAASPVSHDAASPPRRVDRRTRRRYLHRYKELVWPFRLNVLGLIAVGAVAAGLEMLSPAAFGIIINLLDRGVLPWILPVEGQPLAPNEKYYWVAVIAGVMAVLVILARGLEIFRNTRTIALNHKIIIRLRRKLHRHMLNLPLAEIQEMKTGAVVSRLSTDVDKATGLVQQAIMSPAAALWRLLIGSAIMFYWNWKLALVAWAILPPMLLISLMWVKRIRPIFRSAGRDRNEIDARATETFGGIRVVRSFNREPRERHDYTVSDNTMIRKRLFAYNIGLTIDSAWQMLIPLSTILLAGIGGWLVLNGRADIGQLASFQVYVPMLLGPIFRIVSTLNATQESLAAMERVFEVLDKPQDKPDKPDAVDAPRTVREFTFDGVHFAYGDGPEVIHDFNLSVPGGNVVAFVGPSGAGKTTITDLIARFYDPTRGSIRVNGIDLRDIKLRSYRRLLAIVPQEVFLFDGTVRENIAYGRRHAAEADLIDAARRANAWDFIQDLPDGLETIIGERGVKLSGGQRQRISIARAILADPQILILDEATSNLDTESEQLIQAALADLYENRTTFVIAHRLSTVTHADQIVVMERGCIVEQGTHEQLMAQEGAYYEMVERQRQFAPEAGLA